MRRTTTGNSLSLSILFSSAPRALTIKCPRTKSKMKNNKMTHSSPIKKFGLSFITTMGLRKNWEWKGLRFDTSQRQRTLMFLPHTHVKLMEYKFLLLFFHELKSYYLSYDILLHQLMIHNQRYNLYMKRVCSSGFLSLSAINLLCWCYKTFRVTIETR